MLNQNCRRLLASSTAVTAMFTFSGSFLVDSIPAEPVTVSPQAAREVFIAQVTAYASSSDETNGQSFITASGQQVRDGIVACPRKFPFGTKFVIEQKVYECLDRLAIEHDHRFDIWKPNLTEAVQFGIQELPVEAFLQASDDGRYHR